MKAISHLIITSALVLSTTGCDKIEKPLDDGATISCDPAVLVPRKVLIEDMTGHLCNNCPAAAKVAEEIDAFYDDNAIIIGVHVTPTFADPIDSSEAVSRGYPWDSFKTDFQTPAGDALLAEYPVIGLPAGLISRRTFNSSIVLGSGNWFSAAADIICKEASALVAIDNVVYNSGSRDVTAEVSVQSQVDLSGQHRLTVYITEDHIIDWQLDVDATPPYVEDYEHRHVLRAKIDAGGNGNVLGQPLFTSSSSGDITTVNISGNIANEWDATNCYLVAFVTDPSGEVLQAEEIAIIP